MPLHVSVVKVKNHQYIRVYSSYRNEKGQPRSRIIENHGRLDAALEKDPQYVENLKKRIAQENALEAQNKSLELENQAKRRMDKLADSAKGLNEKPGNFKSLNVGSALIRKVWLDLKMPEMFRHLQKGRKIQYPYDQTAYLLTEQRFLNPSSKLKSFNNRAHSIIDHGQVDHLEDLYKVLDVLQEDKKTIVRHLNKEIQKRTKRTVTAAFYDVTTYSFESRSVSEYKDFGLSKDHKVNEVQVVLGLVMDENGIPIDYELFAGNTSEFGTMVPLIKKIKNTYHLKQLIVVADRGLNCAENLFALKEIGCDFVIAQKFKNSAAEIKTQILDPDNWEEFICKDDGEVKCQYKTLNVIQELHERKESPTTHRRYPGPKVLGTMELNWIVSYSPARAAKDKADRDRAIEKAKKAVDDPNRLRSCGYKSLITIPKGTGSPRINWDKIKEQAKWDGYYVICTNLEISPHEATSIYRKLWQIEDCFRVSKTHLETRPCFVWTDPHIYGHFLSCFISLVIEKYMLFMLKRELGKEEITHDKMLESIKTARVVYDDINPQVPLYLRLYEAGLFDRMSTVFGLDALNRVETPSSLRRKLHLPIAKTLATQT